MAELLIRAGAADAALIERVLSGAAEGRPHRLVVDAHVSLREPRLSQAARTAGIPLIVDPQTHFLQDFQHGADPWAQLPFGGGAHPSTPIDLLNRSRLDGLVAAVVEHQLEAGATVVVPPYMHIESRDDGWCEAQIAMWHATRRYLDAQGLQLPVLTVVALGWRMLEREAGRTRFGRSSEPWQLYGPRRWRSLHLSLMPALSLMSGSRPSSQSFVDLRGTIRWLLGNRASWERSPSRRVQLAMSAASGGASAATCARPWRVDESRRVVEAHGRCTSVRSAVGFRSPHSGCCWTTQGSPLESSVWISRAARTGAAIS
jgi:hypothetical protein